MSRYSSLYRYSLAGRNSFYLTRSDGEANGIAVDTDPNNKYIYWSDR